MAVSRVTHSNISILKLQLGNVGYNPCYRVRVFKWMLFVGIGFSLDQSLSDIKYPIHKLDLLPLYTSMIVSEYSNLFLVRSL